MKIKPYKLDGEQASSSRYECYFTNLRAKCGQQFLAELNISSLESAVYLNKKDVGKRASMGAELTHICSSQHPSALRAVCYGYAGQRGRSRMCGSHARYFIGRG